MLHSLAKVSRILGLFLLFFVAACGSIKEDSSSKTDYFFNSSTRECVALKEVANDPQASNVGYGSLTFTHPDFMNYFKFTKILSKLKQVGSDDDRQEIARRIIHSFLVTQVKNVVAPQPIRPFVIPELLCPLLSSDQQRNASFCGSQFNQNRPAAINAAVAFLDRRESFQNFIAIDKIWQPLSLVIRPQRLDLAANQQDVDVRVIYGLRDAGGAQRKPATLIFEFASPTRRLFYENIARLFWAYRNRNDKASIAEWSRSFENNIDCGSVGKCSIERGWLIKQIRMNELAFRGDDVLWNFREYKFPSFDSPLSDFAQVPLAFTPLVDFDKKDKDPALMNDDFNVFLHGKGLDGTSPNADQSIDLFEDFMADRKATVSNSGQLQSFALEKMFQVNNSVPTAGSKAYPFHQDPQLAAGSGLARPGMKFFDGDNNWSKSLKESCQGCHVSTSSLARAESVDTMQGFYQISPRLEPTGADKGMKAAGVNILSTLVLRETKLRLHSFQSIIGCFSPPTS